MGPLRAPLAIDILPFLQIHVYQMYIDKCAPLYVGADL